MGKLKLAFPFSDQVCKRPWNFERVPNSIIQGHDRALIFTSTKEACLAACLNEVKCAKFNIIRVRVAFQGIEWGG